MALKRRTENDRRIIERISTPHLRMHLRQIRWSLLGLCFLSGGSAVYFFAKGREADEITYGIFMGVTLIVLATLFWRYYQAIMLFLENESASNLGRSMERQSMVWIAIVLFSITYIIVQLMFR